MIVWSAQLKVQWLEIAFQIREEPVAGTETTNEENRLKTP